MRLLSIILLLYSTGVFAQSKKPLDHQVYDGWERVQNPVISADGRFVAYTVSPQQGDGALVVSDLLTRDSIHIARGTRAVITPNSRYLLCRIKPYFAETRKARIQKKKPDEMPADTLGIVRLDSLAVTRVPDLESFKVPEESEDLFGYLLSDKEPAEDSSDSIPGGADSLQTGNLVIYSMRTEREKRFADVKQYAFSKNGLKTALVAEKENPDPADSTRLKSVFLYDPEKGHTDTLSTGHTYKTLAFDESGAQLAFLATSDSTEALQQFFQLHYYTQGMDSAAIRVDKSNKHMPQGWSVSEHASLRFSKAGDKLFFATAPVRPPRDTAIVDFEVADLDIWSYQDTDIQPMQLKNLDKELKRDYLAVYYPASGKKSRDDSGPPAGQGRFVQLGTEHIPEVVIPEDGKGNMTIGISDLPYRTQIQWQGHAYYDVYTIDMETGDTSRTAAKLRGRPRLSPGLEYFYWYDAARKNWYAQQLGEETPVNLTGAAGVNFFDEEHDAPSDPRSYGMAGWTDDDAYFIVYDRYDIWAVDPEKPEKARNLTSGYGRSLELTLRYVRLDPEEKTIPLEKEILLSAFDHQEKQHGFYLDDFRRAREREPQRLVLNGYTYNHPIKAREAPELLFQRSNFRTPPDLFVTADYFKESTALSRINPDMKQYRWGDVELVSWTAPGGRRAEGLLYKPEDFDPSQQYPMLVYFYEKRSDTRYQYYAPQPSRSTINIPFFVSNGYLVFIPDIHYTTGYPGKSACDYVISGTDSLIARGFVDTARIGLNGQSWGGYQVAYIITQTDKYAAAMAGAPVSNMTSAYGGIRWGTGRSRQYQYEKTQSRIGATLWEKPELYLENSPLFKADQVHTPLLMMHNDADGAVPWYQGIEYFMALRRLGKPAWMLVYNGEEHNLSKRKNQKDLSIRMQQFYDHFLKGAAKPLWMDKGLPAVEKGHTWNYELTEPREAASPAGGASAGEESSNGDRPGY